MAATVTSRKLKLQFTVTPSEDSPSSKRTWTFPEISNEIETSDVQAFATAMITNSAVFDTPPLSTLTAILEETTTEKLIPTE